MCAHTSKANKGIKVDNTPQRNQASYKRMCTTAVTAKNNKPQSLGQNVMSTRIPMN